MLPWDEITFVSSTNIIDSRILEILQRSLVCIMRSSKWPKTDSSGNPHLYLDD